MVPSLHASGCALHGGDDAHVSSAAAKVVGKRLLDVGFARLLVAGKEGGRFHDHAVDAVAALHGLLVDEGLLHGMQLLDRAARPRQAPAWSGSNGSIAQERCGEQVGACDRSAGLVISSRLASSYSTAAKARSVQST